MSNKSKYLQGVVYSTDPQYQYQKQKEVHQENLPNQKQQLRVRIEKQHRGGKTVTVVDGFVGKEDELLKLGQLLKQKCGTGGSARREGIATARADSDGGSVEADEDDCLQNLKDLHGGPAPFSKRGARQQGN